MSWPRIACVFLVALAACKAREGERCLCADDCRDGLVCVVDGAALQDGECAPDGQSGAGKCVNKSDVPDDDAGEGDDEGWEPDPDPSRRDFEPQGPDTESGITTTTTTTTDTTATTTPTTSTSATAADTSSESTTSTTTTGATSTGSTATTSGGRAANGSQ